MNHRTLGRSGLEVSVVGLGCNNFGMRIDLEATRKVVAKALDLGITLFDTADIYGNMGGSETMLGQVLNERRKDIEYSLLVRQVESEKLPAAEAYGMGVLPYFPLASGLLTGKYRRGVEASAETRFANLQGLAKRYLTDANWARVEQLEAFCAKRGRTLLELAFSWLLARPAVASVIAGATKPEQVEANVNAVNWTLTPEDLTEIDRLTLPA